MLTKKQAEDILCFVAQEILSPMAFRQDITASDYWLEKTGDTFNRLCALVHKYTEKEPNPPQLHLTK